LELHFGLVNEFHQFAAVEAFELSKALGNVRRRKLRTDDTEIMISLSRPVILNSIIQGLIEAGDLASRALVVRTKSIGDDGKTTVEGLNFEFEKNGPLNLRCANQRRKHYSQKSAKCLNDRITSDGGFFAMVHCR
jgi:hypothetical protein